jgi:hypothetical protein
LDDQVDTKVAIKHQQCEMILQELEETKNDYRDLNRAYNNDDQFNEE